MYLQPLLDEAQEEGKFNENINIPNIEEKFNNELTI